LLHTEAFHGTRKSKSTSSTTRTTRSKRVEVDFDDDDDDSSENTAIDGKYKVEGSVRLPRNTKASNARIVLNGGEYIGIVRIDGSFTVHGVPPGTYVFEINLADFIFDPIRIDVSAKNKGKIRALNLKTKERMHYPLALRPSDRAKYFQVREPYNWANMLKNPMVWMMGVTLVIIVIFPKMLANMDPKEMEEMKRMSMSNLMKK